MDEEFFKEYLVTKAPKTVYYIPDYITEEEEDYLTRQVYNAPKPKWTCLSNRRLQNYGGIPHKNGLFPENIPSWLQTYMDRISDLNVFFDQDLHPLRANHCLVNEYLPGQGIMPHSDGPIFTQTITTINLGSHTTLEFYTNDELRTAAAKLLLQPRSLVIIKDRMYDSYLHGIKETTKDVLDEDYCNLKDSFKIGECLERKTRLSLTIRNVPKLIKCNLFNLIKK